MKQLYTVWGESLNSAHVLQEYPRPLLYRAGYRSLNGYWTYAIAENHRRPKGPEGTILVPFSPESVLSGVGRQLKPGQTLWYRRTFLYRQPEHTRTFLHFGAVDQECAVYLNGRKIGYHGGGYLPFSCEMTQELTDGSNDLIVAVRDVSDTSYHARGKQKLKRGGMYYTAVSGIWQSVWMESVPAVFIRSLDVRPDPDGRCVRIRVRARKNMPVRIRICAPHIYREQEFDYERALWKGLSEEDIIAQAQGKAGSVITVSLPQVRLWSPESPELYYFTVDLLTEDGTETDRVISYFALRSVSVEPDRRGIPRIMLNHHPYFEAGVLDQGYWPDGLYTAPSDEALQFDVRGMAEAGFNMVRMHGKIEADRWYYHCDRIGLLVWQDMVNGGEAYHDWFVTYLATFTAWLQLPTSDRLSFLLSRTNLRGKKEFEREMRETVRVLRNHPCIIEWTLFNEGWGQFDTERLTKELKRLDPGRLVDAASGWFDRGCGDINSIHYYYLTPRFKEGLSRAHVISEFGGLAHRVPGHSSCLHEYGYRRYMTRRGLRDKYRRLIARTVRIDGLSGFVYTQWNDVEEETNGIYTYDRKVKKI
jgi:beta-galactosidase/beta-glucuronidase